MSHVCTCGDCAVAPFDDRCKHEIRAREITAEITAWLRENARDLEAALREGRRPTSPVSPSGARELARVIESRWGAEHSEDLTAD